MDDDSDALAITGLIEGGCLRCRAAMDAGHGNPKLCATCKKPSIVYYVPEKGSATTWVTQSKE
jgi:hypothetical protein